MNIFTNIISVFSARHIPELFIKSSKALTLSVLMTFSLSALAELKVGDNAPNFKLPAADGNTYQLSDYRGKQAVVLAWFPKAGTRYCTLECKSFVDHGQDLKQYDMQYFMASVDELEENLEFANDTKADFPILSDATKEVAKAYDVLSFLGYSNRVTFYISKEGKILMIDDDIHAKTAATDMMQNLDDLAVGKLAISKLAIDKQAAQTAQAAE